MVVEKNKKKRKCPATHRDREATKKSQKQRKIFCAKFFCVRKQKNPTNSKKTSNTMSDIATKRRKLSADSHTMTKKLQDYDWSLLYLYKRKREKQWYFYSGKLKGQELQAFQETVRCLNVQSNLQRPLRISYIKLNPLKCKRLC